MQRRKATPDPGSSIVGQRPSFTEVLPMQPRRLKYFRSAIRAAALACLACLLLGTVSAGPSAVGTTGLVVHEWGTFTVVVGSDGAPVRWRPVHDTSDLPGFVQTRNRNGKTEISGTVRMETPVIYFYSDRDTRVSVAVDFPNGQITEWYPSATLPGNAKSISWNDVRVVPGAEEAFPTTAGSSHYYAARETDASPLVVSTADGQSQREKMLFYRGVGTFGLPLVASVNAEGVSLECRGRSPSHAIVVECRNGSVGFVDVDLSSGSATVARPKTVDVGIAALRSVLAARLAAEGLFAREASAMIATWGDTWTEDGLRVFFVVPRSETDRLLPLGIRPSPDAIERVILGRIEIVTPETESAVSAMAVKLAGSPDGRAVALRQLNALGHFLEPIVKIVANRNGDGPVARALRDALPEVFREY